MVQSQLTLINYENTQCVQFRTKNSIPFGSEIIHGNNTISIVSHTKFLGIVIDNTLSWSNSYGRNSE
jgi:hypothetical protein